MNNTTNTTTLTDYVDTMRESLWVFYEECGAVYNTGETMTGFEMLRAINEATSWDQEATEKVEGITAKDLLVTLCDVFGIDWNNAESWDDVHTELLKFIDNIGE